jgi:ribosomal protein S18 acetylase RimI-like enzyme
VRPEYRGKGAYRAMYAKIKEMAHEQGVTQVRLYVDKTNYRAQQVYKKLGMDECHYLMYEEVLG